MFKKLIILLLFISLNYTLYISFTPLTNYKLYFNPFAFKYVSFFVSIIFIIMIDAFNFLLLKKHLNWLQVLMHEMYHSLASIITGGNIKEMSIKEDSGFVNHYGSKATDFVTFSPYIIPYSSIFIYLWIFLIKIEYKFLIIIAVSFSFGFYLIRIIKDAKPFQPDVKSIHFFWFYPIFIVANLFWLQIFIFLVK